MVVSHGRPRPNARARHRARRRRELANVAAVDRSPRASNTINELEPNPTSPRTPRSGTASGTDSPRARTVWQMTGAPAICDFDRDPHHERPFAADHLGTDHRDLLHLIIGGIEPPLTRQPVEQKEAEGWNEPFDVESSWKWPAIARARRRLDRTRTASTPCETTLLGTSHSRSSTAARCPRNGKVSSTLPSMIRIVPANQFPPAVPGQLHLDAPGVVLLIDRLHLHHIVGGTSTTVLRPISCPPASWW